MGKLCSYPDEQPDEGELLSPCRCDGSVKCTHQPCLIKWISERGCWSCELCYYKYHVIAISTKNPLQWQAISLTVIEKVQIAAAILGSLFLIASISWLIWSTFSPSAKWQRQDLLFQICYGMYGFMDIVCIGRSAYKLSNGVTSTASEQAQHPISMNEGKRAILLRKVFDNLDPYPECNCTRYKRRHLAS
ncbi:membrane associated ring-CH-type finger 4 [Turdus rufiventris]|nr:membrane associated ring-CH-type finger 4 [Turdus rufiventris]